MDIKNIAVLIPSLEPDERLLHYTAELSAAGFGTVVVIDDGSGSAYRMLFEDVSKIDRCVVLRHEVNLGKGAALRTGIRYLRDKTDFSGVITADSDGQHTVKDTLLLARQLVGGIRVLLLGSRDFSKKSKNIPIKSRTGNRCTSAVFALLYGRWLPDTQTGLRAAPRECFDFLLNVEGNRFDYEMNMLIQCTVSGIPMHVIPIETIYNEKNKGTHFRPLLDSFRIYRLLVGSFFRFAASGFVSSMVDIALFALLMSNWTSDLFGAEKIRILLFGMSVSLWEIPATVIARVCSASLNFYLNRRFVFRLHECPGAIRRYFLLCAGVMLMSGLLVTAISTVIPVPETVIKIVVDFLLFFINFRIQKAWVFRNK